MPRINPWLLGGAVVVGVMLLGAVAKAELIPVAFSPEPEDADLDALTRMLIAETGFVRDKNEMAQIVFVAVNRARIYKKSLRVVVTPPGSPLWNGANAYRDGFNKADRNPRYAAARVFVQSVLDGAYKNAGGRAFVHPGGMPTPPCSSNRFATSTIAGTRCLPEWAVTGRVIGGAMFA